MPRVLGPGCWLFVALALLACGGGQKYERVSVQTLDERGQAYIDVPVELQVGYLHFNNGVVLENESDFRPYIFTDLAHTALMDKLMGFVFRPGRGPSDVQYYIIRGVGSGSGSMKVHSVTVCVKGKRYTFRK